MPTGYTFAVAEGKVTDLAEFLRALARGMGFTGFMRDEPLDAPIPTTYTSEVGYYTKTSLEAKQRVNTLIAMSDDMIFEAAREAHSDAHKRWEVRAAQRAVERARYEAMIEALNAWKPTHEVTISLKRFGLEQLNTSIEHDCNGTYDREPAEVPAKEWAAKEIERASHNYSYAEAELEKDRKRAEQITTWLAAFHADIAALASRRGDA